jgi:hypothetical protein
MAALSPKIPGRTGLGGVGFGVIEPALRRRTGDGDYLNGGTPGQVLAHDTLATSDEHKSTAAN